jgi:hypothetical protein
MLTEASEMVNGGPLAGRMSRPSSVGARFSRVQPKRKYAAEVLAHILAIASPSGINTSS